MGIRVDKTAMEVQLELAGKEIKPGEKPLIEFYEKIFKPTLYE